MGGGTCYNGGWLPPGMPIPGGGSASPTTTPPPPPPSGVTACPGTDPFVGVDGLVGLCKDGNWLPIQGQTGTVRFNSTRGAWTIVGDDGVTYLPLTTLDSSLQIRGLRVFFAGVPQGMQNGMMMMQMIKVSAL